MLMLNTISPNIISLPGLTLSYTVKQNVIYQLVNVIYHVYIYILIACFGKLVSYLNTIIYLYSENIASYCDSILITFNTIYNDVDIIFLHYS